MKLRLLFEGGGGGSSYFKPVSYRLWESVSFYFHFSLIGVHYEIKIFIMFYCSFT